MAKNRDFWLTSGFHLLQRDDDGRMLVTDDFLRAYLQRPELAPVAESCVEERRLHATLLDAPRRTVTTAELGRLADADARGAGTVCMALQVAASSIQSGTSWIAPLARSSSRHRATTSAFRSMSS